MGRIDLDQHWPLPPYRGRAQSRAGSSSAPDHPYPEHPRPDHAHAEPPDDDDAGDTSRRGLDEVALAKALTDALSARAGSDDRSVADAHALAEIPNASGSAEIGIERPPETRDSRRRVALPLVWSGLGFAAGIVASHLIGFWAFVSNVVVNGHDNGHASRTPVATVSAPVPRSDLAQRVAGNPTAALQAATAAAPGRCIALSIDRVLGQTHLAGCEEQETTLRDAGFRRRGDLVTVRPRLQDPAAWSNTTAVQPDVETGTLQASDVDLNLDH